MRYILILFALFLGSLSAAAQSDEVDNTRYKIVYHLTTADTLAHKALVKQLANVLNAAPKAQLEVVCHNMGIYFLVTEKTQQAAGIRELKARGVDFVGCENTLRERKINRSELMPEVRTVPAGILEIVKKQRKKWSYIKAG
jgi:intracellular sulfur oxidation DsrE/DsrF family protein